MTQPFDILLLDLNGTFMFGHDRLGPGEPFGRTYREAGGTELPDERVSSIVCELVETLTATGRRADRFDSFPSVLETLRGLPTAHGLPDTELRLLERVVAAHEIGRVPDRYAAFVAALAERYRLGLVSNLWSRPGPWRRELERAGLGAAFEWLLFSSDGRSIKPSPRFFDPVLASWTGPRDRVLLVGDSLRRDVTGARNIGVPSLWIAGDAEATSPAPEPDYRARDLLDAADLLLPGPLPGSPVSSGGRGHRGGHGPA